MKKVIFTLLFLAAATIGFSSEASADTTQSEVPTGYEEVEVVDSQAGSNGGVLYILEDGSEVTIYDEEVENVEFYQEKRSPLLRAEPPKSLYYSMQKSGGYSPPAAPYVNTFRHFTRYIGNRLAGYKATYYGNVPWTGRYQQSATQYLHYFKGNIPKRSEQFVGYM